MDLRDPVVRDDIRSRIKAAAWDSDLPLRVVAAEAGVSVQMAWSLLREDRPLSRSWLHRDGKPPDSLCFGCTTYRPRHDPACVLRRARLAIGS